jgi:hypothetical protein
VDKVQKMRADWDKKKTIWVVFEGVLFFPFFRFFRFFIINFGIVFESFVTQRQRLS